MKMQTLKGENGAQAIVQLVHTTGNGSAWFQFTWGTMNMAGLAMMKTIKMLPFMSRRTKIKLLSTIIGGALVGVLLSVPN